MLRFRLHKATIANVKTSEEVFTIVLMAGNMKQATGSQHFQIFLDPLIDINKYL